MRTVQLIACLTVLVLVAGCSGLEGTWTADRSSGSENPIASVTFCSDRTFTAAAQYGGNRSHVISGHYKRADGEIEFDMNGDLRRYGYELNGDELFLRHGGKKYRLVRMAPRR